MIWLRFIGIQIAQLLAAFVMAFVLIPFCLLQAWEDGGISIKDGRPIDRWKWKPLNLISGNPEDGVSGRYALVNGNQPYMPGASAFWRAYSWSALRNSVDALKYRFAIPGAPLIQWKITISGKAGWQTENGYNVPVCSPFSVEK